MLTSVISDVGNVFLTEIFVTFCKFVTSTAFATFTNDFFNETKSYFRDDLLISFLPPSFLPTLASFWIFKKGLW